MANRPSKAPDDAHVDKEKVALGKETLRHLDKLVKTRHLFSPGHENVEAVLKEFKDRIGDYFEVYDELALDIDSGKMYFEGVLMSDAGTSKEDYKYRLFQDGVILLKLRRGIDDKEIDQLLGILLADFRSGPFCHDDTVTLFWETKPKFFRLGVAPEFDDTSSDTKKGGGEGSSMFREALNCLMERRAEAGPTVDKPPTETQTQQITKLEGLFREERYSLKKKERKELLELVKAGEPHLVGKYVEVLLRAMAFMEKQEDKDRGRSVIKQLFFGMVEGEGIEEACGLLQRLQSISTDPGAGDQIMASVKDILNEVRSPELITRVMRGLSPQTVGDMVEDRHVDLVMRFLSLIGSPSIPDILLNLSNVPSPEIREKIAKLVARMGPEEIRLYKKYLADAKSDIISEIVIILVTIGSEEAIEAMLTAISNPNVDVRLKVLEHIGDLKTSKVANALVGRLKDPEARVRDIALRKLKGMEGQDIARKMQAVTREADFSYRDKDEKRNIFIAIGRLGGKSTISFFKEHFNTKNLLKRPAIDEARGSAAYMLGVLGDNSSRDALVKGSKSRFGSAYFRSACTQALSILDGALDPNKAEAAK
jgi:HEAT repeat protein